MFSRLRHRRVVLTLSNGEMFAGTVADHGKRHVLLIGVEAVEPESGARSPVPGAMRFARATILYVQEL